MKVVRIKLTQRMAHYRREETVDNKMTYPLPPLSTVIGALHKACRYQEYHPMDISIQGEYGGLNRRVYYDSCFLNSLQNDRGCLVKMKNSDMLSNAFDIVAEAKKAQGNDFRKGITIQVYNKELLDEYRRLKDTYDEIAKLKSEKLKPYLDSIKKEKQILKKEKESNKDNLSRVEEIKQKEKELSCKEKEAKEKLKQYEQDNYQIPISRFRTLTRGPKYYEILTDVQLILHVHAQEEVMNDIVDNIGNLTALGRGEDFVDVQECKIVDIHSAQEDGEEYYQCEESAYIDAKVFLRDEIIPSGALGVGMRIYGTRYSLNKNYEIKDNKRVFEKKSVIYTSNFQIMNETDNVFIDRFNDEKYYIVNLL